MFLQEAVNGNPSAVRLPQRLLWHWLAAAAAAAWRVRQSFAFIQTKVMLHLTALLCLLSFRCRSAVGGCDRRQGANVWFPAHVYCHGPESRPQERRRCRGRLTEALQRGTDTGMYRAQGHNNKETMTHKETSDWGGGKKSLPGNRSLKQVGSK